MSTLNVNCTCSVMFSGVLHYMYIIPLNILAQGGIHNILRFHALSFMAFSWRFKKKQHTNKPPATLQAFNNLIFSHASVSIYFGVGPCYFHLRYTVNHRPILASWGAHGMLRSYRVPRGHSLAFYGVFISPLNRRIFLQILVFLTDSSFQFTLDTHCFSLSCAFFCRQTLTFREVDTPSVAADDSDG